MYGLEYSVRVITAQRYVVRLIWGRDPRSPEFYEIAPYFSKQSQCPNEILKMSHFYPVFSNISPVWPVILKLQRGSFFLIKTQYNSFNNTK